MVRGLLTGFQSLLFPASCLGCRLPVETDRSWPLCSACLKKLPLWQGPWCARCGQSLSGAGAGVTLCRACKENRRSFDEAVSCFPYKGMVQELVLAFKYGGKTGLLPFLAERMFLQVRRQMGNDPADWVVPVPLHPVRARERGFDQAQLLAGALALKLSLPQARGLLKRGRATAPQAQLTRAERFKNVREAFCLRPRPSLGRSRILLVDDVFTTGATANACAALLKKAGAARVTVVTFARG
ncbi:MAG: ComF family protein [Candidatus Omnitrophica bacterium]|nr:ComF family protein [Candidatus Omnitrophota bacterium]